MTHLTVNGSSVVVLSQISEEGSTLHIPNTLTKKNVFLTEIMPLKKCTIMCTVKEKLACIACK